jgi:hypothetical protein
VGTEENRGKPVKRIAALVVALIMLGACTPSPGTFHLSGVEREEVDTQEPLPVQVIPMTPGSLRAANAHPYVGTQAPASLLSVPTARSNPSSILPNPTAKPPRRPSTATWLPQGPAPTTDEEKRAFEEGFIVVGGDVKFPQTVPLTPGGVELMAMIARVGGTNARKPEDALILLIREGQKYQVLESELRQWLPSVPLRAGDLVQVEDLRDIDEERVRFQQEIQLQETDLNRRRATAAEQRGAYLAALNVGAVPRDYVYVAGGVVVQGRYALPLAGRAVIADAMFAEGRGVQIRDGDPRHIYLVRMVPGSDSVSAYWLDARNAANLVLTTQFELRLRDIVFVSSKPLTDWSDYINKALPWLYGLNAVLDIPIKVGDARIRQQDIEIRQNQIDNF